MSGIDINSLEEQINTTSDDSIAYEIEKTLHNLGIEHSECNKMKELLLLKNQ